MCSMHHPTWICPIQSVHLNIALRCNICLGRSFFSQTSNICCLLKVQKAFLRSENLQGKRLTDDLTRVYGESFTVWKRASSPPLTPSNIPHNHNSLLFVWFGNDLFTTSKHIFHRADVHCACTNLCQVYAHARPESFPAQYWWRQFIIWTDSCLNLTGSINMNVIFCHMWHWSAIKVRARVEILVKERSSREHWAQQHERYGGRRLPTFGFMQIWLRLAEWTHSKETQLYFFGLTHSHIPIHIP